MLLWPPSYPAPTQNDARNLHVWDLNSAEDSRGTQVKSTERTLSLTGAASGSNSDSDAVIVTADLASDTLKVLAFDKQVATRHKARLCIRDDPGQAVGRPRRRVREDQQASCTARKVTMISCCPRGDLVAAYCDDGSLLYFPILEGAEEPGVVLSPAQVGGLHKGFEPLACQLRNVQVEPRAQRVGRTHVLVAALGCPDDNKFVLDVKKLVLPRDTPVVGKRTRDMSPAPQPAR